MRGEGARWWLEPISPIRRIRLNPAPMRPMPNAFVYCRDETPEIFILKGLHLVARGRGAIATTTPGLVISWICTLKGVAACQRRRMCIGRPHPLRPTCGDKSSEKGATTLLSWGRVEGQWEELRASHWLRTRPHPKSVVPPFDSSRSLLDPGLPSPIPCRDQEWIVPQSNP